MLSSSLLLIARLCLLFDGGLFLVRKTELDDNYRRFEHRGAQFYFLPGARKIIVEFDSSLDLSNNLVLPMASSFSFNDLRVSDGVLVLSDGDSLYRFYPRFGKIETFYRSAHIVDFTLGADGDVLVAEQFGRQIVLLDRLGRDKFSLTRYRVRALAYARGAFWLAERNRWVKIDEFGNERASIPVAGTRRLAADGGLVAGLGADGRQVVVLAGDSARAFRTEDELGDLRLGEGRTFGLGVKGNVLFEYSIDLD